MRKLRVLVVVFVRVSTTRGRMAALLALGAFAVLLGVVVRTAPNADADAPGGLIDALGLALFVPVAALLIATGTLGQLRNDGSLIYVWLRPVSRLVIATAAWIAAVLVTVPSVGVPLVVTASVAGGSSDLVVATALASALALVAYCGVFVALGLLTRYAAIWGIAYILIWEGLLAALGGGINRLALRNYSRSVLENVGGVDLTLADASTGVAIGVLLVVAAVAVALTAVRLVRLDVE